MGWLNSLNAIRGEGGSTPGVTGVDVLNPDADNPVYRYQIRGDVTPESRVPKAQREVLRAQHSGLATEEDADVTRLQ